MSLIEDYDRQQAFSAGFALAARDWGLSKDEYESFCKVAAAAVVPILSPEAAATKQREDFVAQKAQAVKAGSPSTGEYAQNQQNAARANLMKKSGAAATQPAAARRPTPPLPPAPPADNAPPMTPPGVSAFSPEAAPAVTATRNAQLRKALSPKDYVRQKAVEQVADLEVQNGLAPPTAKVRQQQEAVARANAQPVAQPPALTKAPLPPVTPRASSPGSIAPGLGQAYSNLIHNP